MMKKVTAVLISFLLVLTLSTMAHEKDKKENQANNLNGTVVDKITGETLAGVEVILQGTSMTAISDLDGNFSFNGLKPGSYTIKIAYISYKELVEEIKVDNEASASLQIALEIR